MPVIYRVCLLHYSHKFDPDDLLEFSAVRILTLVQDFIFFCCADDEWDFHQY